MKLKTMLATATTFILLGGMLVIAHAEEESLNFKSRGRLQSENVVFDYKDFALIEDAVKTGAYKSYIDGYNQGQEDILNNSSEYGLYTKQIVNNIIQTLPQFTLRTGNVATGNPDYAKIDVREIKKVRVSCTGYSTSYPYNYIYDFDTGTKLGQTYQYGWVDIDVTNVNYLKILNDSPKDVDYKGFVDVRALELK